eukprot:5757548-Pyramimonas_sp.AAC.1
MAAPAAAGVVHAHGGVPFGRTPRTLLVLPPVVCLQASDDGVRDEVSQGVPCPIRGCIGRQSARAAACSALLITSAVSE